jgi:hypothetical protein
MHIRGRVCEKKEVELRTPKLQILHTNLTQLLLMTLPLQPAPVYALHSPSGNLQNEFQQLPT